MENFSDKFTFNELTDSLQHKELVTKNRENAKKFIQSGIKLSALLAEIRVILGNEPIAVTSGFRDDKLNTAVGSKAKSSAHKKFEAADIKHSKLSASQAFKIIIDNKEKLPTLRKVILETIGNKNWLHVEVKTSDSDKLAFYITTNGSKYTKVTTV